MIALLKSTGYDLPPRETVEDLTIEEIFYKIEEFMSNANPKHEDLVFDFWQLIRQYPVSMCKRQMSDTLKLVINLFYHYKPPKINLQDRDMNELYQAMRQQWKGLYSYETLAIIFCRSKASIHDAIKEKEAEVKRLVEEVNMRRHARSIAFQEVVAEEKIKLLKKSSKGFEKTNQTIERTLSA